MLSPVSRASLTSSSSLITLRNLRPPAPLPPLAATSFLNRTEATNVEKIITRFLQCGVTPSQIGVVTPYEGQRAHVVSVLIRQGTLRQDLYKVREGGVLVAILPFPPPLYAPRPPLRTSR